MNKQQGYYIPNFMSIALLAVEIYRKIYMVKAKKIHIFDNK